MVTNPDCDCHYCRALAKRDKRFERLLILALVLFAAHIIYSLFWK